MIQLKKGFGISRKFRNRKMENKKYFFLFRNSRIHVKKQKMENSLVKWKKVSNQGIAIHFTDSFVRKTSNFFLIGILYLSKFGFFVYCSILFFFLFFFVILSESLNFSDLHVWTFCPYQNLFEIFGIVKAETPLVSSKIVGIKNVKSQ